MIHNRVTFKVSISCVLGLGLLLGLLILLRTPPAPVRAAFATAVAERTSVGTARATPGDSLAAPGLTTGSIITVCPGADCDFAVIQDAVDAAFAGDEIRVAAGVYTDVNNRGGLAQIVYVDKTVTIRGGYTTTNWTTSDPVANPTMLDAQGQGRVVYIGGHSPVIEGLHIEGGRAHGLGGGLWYADDAGGGVYVDGGTSIIRDSVILRNTADIGGGLYLHESSAQLIANTVISNTAQFGGGLSVYRSPALIRGNTFEHNSASDQAGGLYIDQSFVEVRDNRVASNTADKGGGGLSIRRGGGVVAGNSIVSNDSAGYGGGLYVFDSTARLTANRITENEARGEYGGGGLCISRGRPRLEENVIIGNTAGERGGGISFFNVNEAMLINTVLAENHAGDSGSGVYVLGGTLELLHTTLAGSGPDGFTTGLGVTTGAGAFLPTDRPDGATSYDNGTGLHVETATVGLTNTILVGHEVGVYASPDATVRLESTLLGAGHWANDADWAGGGALDHQNDYHKPPQFVDPAAGDYDIRANSGAVDRGVDAGVTIDVNGRPRPIGSGFDLGAHESTGIDLSTSSKSASPTAVSVGGVATYTLALVNTGHLIASDVVLTDPIPLSTTYVSGSAKASGGMVSPSADALVWSGAVPSGLPVTITFAVTVTAEGIIENVAEVRDEWNTLTVLRTWLNGARLYLPLIVRSH